MLGGVPRVTGKKVLILLMKGPMEETLNAGSEQVKKAQQFYEDGRRKLQDVAQTASEKSQEVITFTDDWVRQNPWMTVGIVAGIGLLVGLLVGQSCGRSRSDMD